MDIQYGDVFYLNGYILGYVLVLLSCILSSFPLLSNTCTYSYISNFCKESLFNRFVCKLYTWCKKILCPLMVLKDPEMFFPRQVTSYSHFQSISAWVSKTWKSLTFRAFFKGNIRQGRSDHIRMYLRAYLKSLKIYFFNLFIYLTYLFIYRLFGEKRPLHLQEFSLVLLLFYTT